MVSGENNMLFIIIVIIGIIGIILIFAVLLAEKKHQEKIDGYVYPNYIEVKVQLANVSAKRILVAGEYTRTNYYVTFEILENRNRIEFEVSAEVYGMLAEGDKGELSVQGEKFISFVRIID